jgi:HEAT repeat protein
LIKAVNDSQQQVRFAAMRALGEIGEETAIRALTEQLEHYRKGEGAWSALDALARIAHPSSVPLFTARVADKDPYIRRAAVEGLARAKDPSSRTVLESAVSTDPSDTVRAAMAFALQRLGGNYVARLANSLESDKLAAQIAGYFLELGPSVAGQLAVHLKDPSDSIRANAATILGGIGGSAESALLQPLLQDRNTDVRRAAERAIQRINMRGA